MFLKSFEGQAFQRHVFKEIYLTMGIEPYSDCKNRCLMENSCVSVNIGPPDKNGLRVCQLSDSDHTQHPGDLKPQEGYLYWASKCGKNGFYPMMFIYLFFLIKMLLKINLSISQASARSPHFLLIEHFSNNMSLCWLTFSNLLVNSVRKALHRYLGGHGFKSRAGLNFSGITFTTA